MKKARNPIIKNIRYLCLVGVIALGLITIVGSNGDELGEGDGDTTSDEASDSDSASSGSGPWYFEVVVDCTACGGDEITKTFEAYETKEECQQADLQYIRPGACGSGPELCAPVLTTRFCFQDSSDGSGDASDGDDTTTDGTGGGSGDDLMWQNPPAGTKKNWQDAIDYCEELDEDGYNDWRLPTLSELRTLIRGCDNTVTGGLCEADDDCLDSTCIRTIVDCTCEADEGPDDGCYWDTDLDGPCDWRLYWSSSAVEDSEEYAFGICFDRAYVSNDFKHYEKNVRCVR